MKHLLLASLITLLAIATACGQATEPEVEPVASDGIQVHGHWTVTVTNPDGTVDAVHEFDNNLISSTGLTGLLTGQNNVDGWTIVVKPSLVNTTDFSCKEAIGKYTSGSNILEAAVTVTNKPHLPFSLSAACTVTGTGGDQTGEFSTVYTYFYDYDGCTPRWNANQPESGPVQCETLPSMYSKNSSYAGSADLEKLVTGFGGLTHHSLVPVQVSEGQVLGVNVDISFS